MARIAWVITDPTDSTSYFFDVNPSDANTPIFEKSVSEMTLSAPGSRTLLFEGSDKAGKMSISGTLLSQDQHDALLLWYGKRRNLIVTTDLGQVFTMYMVKLGMSRSSSKSYPWKHKFNIDYIEIGS